MSLISSTFADQLSGFNVADIYVTVSVAVFLLLYLLYYKDEDFAFLHKKRQKGGVRWLKKNGFWKLHRDLTENELISA